jgi:hypothetical protein
MPYIRFATDARSLAQSASAATRGAGSAQARARSLKRVANQGHKEERK